MLVSVSQGVSSQVQIKRVFSTNWIHKQPNASVRNELLEYWWEIGNNIGGNSVILLMREYFIGGWNSCYVWPNFQLGFGTLVLRLA